MLIVVPAHDASHGLHWCESNAKQIAQAGAQAIVISTNSKPINSQIISPEIRVIGTDALSAVSEVVARMMEVDQHRLFGIQSYNRGFGGASNLVALFAAASSHDRVLKLDVDCHASGSATELFVFATKCELPSDTVLFGRYLEVRLSEPKFDPQLTELISLLVRPRDELYGNASKLRVKNDP